MNYLLGILLALTMINAALLRPRPTQESVPIRFERGAQTLGSGDTYAVVARDLNGDSALDIVVVNLDQPSRVWLNDGRGRFQPGSTGLASGTACQIIDLNDDGAPDLFLARSQSGNMVYLNDGKGGLTDTGQRLGTSNSTAVVMGDLDRDGDPDAIVTNWEDQPREIWLNDRGGMFTPGCTQSVVVHFSHSASLADLDRDGDLDLFTSENADREHHPVANRVYFNDGTGRLVDSAQCLGSACSYLTALADLDSDGDPDAFVANSSHAGADPVNRVWFNDGAGIFSDSGQQLGNDYSMSVVLADLDDDSDLDAVVGNYRAGNRIYLNYGTGFFRDSGISLGDQNSFALDVADLDGDGDLDIIVGNVTWQGGDGSNRIYFNRSR